MLDKIVGFIFFTFLPLFVPPPLFSLKRKGTFFTHMRPYLPSPLPWQYFDSGLNRFGGQVTEPLDRHHRRANFGVGGKNLAPSNRERRRQKNICNSALALPSPLLAYQQTYAPAQASALSHWIILLLQSAYTAFPSDPKTPATARCFDLQLHLSPASLRSTLPLCPAIDDCREPWLQDHLSRRRWLRYHPSRRPPQCPSPTTRRSGIA